MVMTETDEAPSLSAEDRCDACRAAARVRVAMLNGELLFCGHHFIKHEKPLRTQALSVHDERDELLL